MENQTQSGTSRREFLGAAAAALFAGITITLLGCDEDSGSSPAVAAGDRVAEISDNHPSPHQAVLKKAVIEAGGAVTLNIQGRADHNHTVSLTAEEMSSLKGGGMIHKDSSVAGSHSHTVMFM